MRIIAFTKVNLPYGWLGNMSPYPVEYKSKKYRTTEALFQCMHFENYPQVQEEIMAQTSPMAAKKVSKNYRHLLAIDDNNMREMEKRIGIRIEWMRLCLTLKLDQHTELKEALLLTEDAIIIEDSSNRPNESGLLWGAAFKNGEWIGQNMLGRLWMEQRDKLKKENSSIVSSPLFNLF
jgi:ribA/ribD-fused uncharacterized protein